MDLRRRAEVHLTDREFQSLLAEHYIQQDTSGDFVWCDRRDGNELYSIDCFLVDDNFLDVNWKKLIVREGEKVSSDQLRMLQAMSLFIAEVEYAESSNLRAMDWDQIAQGRVDISGATVSVASSLFEAQNRLGLIREHIGQESFSMLHLLGVQGKTVSGLARKMGASLGSTKQHLRSQIENLADVYECKIFGGRF